MWIPKALYEVLEKAFQRSEQWISTAGVLQGETNRLREENARLVSMNAWMQHRLNQVEMERAMLMQDRLGVKISVPQFVPATDDPAEALGRVMDVSTVGGDAKDDGTDTDADPTQNPGIDYTNLPGYAGKRR